MKRLLMFVAIVCSLTVCSGAADERPALLIYGPGFVFGISEPPGWTGDTDAAKRYHVNVVFFPSDRKSRAADVTIRVRLNEKVDNDTASDLAHDMDEYRAKYPKVNFEDVNVSHPSYRVFPKLFFVPGSFYEYVVYLNPGPDIPFTFSAALSIAEREATEAELQAFRALVSSLKLIQPQPAG
jgi:hypothetical protein